MNKRRSTAFCLTLAILVLISTPAGAQSQAAEWLEAKKILVHTPGQELFMGVIHPEAALFESVFSLEEAAKEHRKFISELEEQGIEVKNLVDLLQNADIDDLRDLARESISFDLSHLHRSDRAEQVEYTHDVISKLSRAELVMAAIQRPVVTLKCADAKLGAKLGVRLLSKKMKLARSSSKRCPVNSFNLVASYQTRPLMNLYFMRDQTITTSEGVVITRLALPQRRYESDLVKLALNAMGMTPIHAITGRRATLEGGDFLPAGDHVFIGRGIRTNQAAIQQLMDNDVFGGKKVLVVEDPKEFREQQEMHLDTYFNIIDKDLVALVDHRNYEVEGEGCQRCPIVEVWEQGANGSYRKTREDLQFSTLLGELGYQIIRASEQDQRAYGVNFLTVRPRKILAVGKLECSDEEPAEDETPCVTQEYVERLEEHGVDVTWVDFSNLRLGYGAAHCTTQVVQRR